jgi:hypothetical protein
MEPTTTRLLVVIAWVGKLQSDKASTIWISLALLDATPTRVGTTQTQVVVTVEEGGIA